MPYASDAQRRFFHTATAKEKGINPSTVKEYDTASKGKNLPERVGGGKQMSPGRMKALKKRTGG